MILDVTSSKYKFCKQRSRYVLIKNIIIIKYSTPNTFCDILYINKTNSFRYLQIHEKIANSKCSR